MPGTPPPARLTLWIALALAAILGAPALLVLLVEEAMPAAAEHPQGLPTATETPAPVPEGPRIHGVIVDGEGNPVAGANVRVLSVTLPPVVRDKTRSDALGRFSFALPDPPFRISADRDPGGVSTSAAISAAPEDLVLSLSSTSGARGTVVDEDGRPVAGATLTPVGAPWELPHGTSDEAGTFAMPLVPDEVNALRVEARGYEPATAAVAPSPLHAERVLEIRLVRAPPVQGMVVADDGSPAKAQVLACAGTADEIRASSGDGGAFELPPAAVGCEAFAEAGDGATSAPAPVHGGETLRLELRAGGVIAGEVVDDRGRHVPTFRVGVEAFAAARGGKRGGGSTKSFDDGSGTFRLDGLVPGSYVLIASAPDSAPARSESVEVTANAVTGGVRIVLRAGGVVEGRVTDEQGGPVAGASVGFDAVSQWRAGGSQTTTDEGGHYRLENAPDGPLSLSVRKSGYRTRLVPGLTVASGETLEQDVTLSADEGQSKLELTGIGATLKPTDRGVEVIALGPDDPAARSGVRVGDRIVRIDGEGTEGLSLSDVVQRLRGPVGSTVGVSVERAGGERADVMITRDRIVR